MSPLYIINLKRESLEELQELCCRPASVIDAVDTVRQMSSAQQIIGWNSKKKKKKTLGVQKNEVYCLIKLFCFDLRFCFVF